MIKRNSIKRTESAKLKLKDPQIKRKDGWCLIKDLKQYIFLGNASANDRIHFLVLHFLHWLQIFLS